MQLFGGKGKMLGLLLVLAAFGSFYLGDITAFTTSQKAIAGVALFIIVLLAGISLLKPKKTEEDMIAEQDERNQYIELKCAEKAFPGRTVRFIYDHYSRHDCLWPDKGICLYLVGYGGDCALRNIKNCLYRFCIPIRQAINGSRKALNEKLRGQDTSFGCVLASIYQLF